jgi:energy-coupling factor transporter ATP-binding protein EcfA2
MEIIIGDSKFITKKPLLIGVVGNYLSFLSDLSNNKNVGYIRKNEYYFTNYVYDELLLSLNKYDKDIKDVDKRIKKVLEVFDLDNSFLDKEISKLSKGEKRLLSYLRVFIYNPKIILIDEPFKNLDYKYEKILIYYLRELKNKYNKTIVIASNNVNVIYENTDKTLIISDEVVFDDTKDIFTNDDILKKYNLYVPNLVMFVKLAAKKDKKIEYHNDIRDLMKDVYRNV